MEKEDARLNLFDFGQAITAVKHGERVARLGWDGGMFIFQGFPRVEINADNGRCVTAVDAAQHLNAYYSGPVLCMKTSQNTIVVGWLATQIDMLAEDGRIGG